MPLRDKSVTLMRFYGFPHHGDRFFAGALNDALPVFLTTGTDPSLALRMTPFVLRHYDAFRSPLLVTCFLQIVILNGGKHALWERRETERWIGVKNLLPGWRLTGFLTMGADPSHSFRMTFYGLLHHGSEPSSSLRVTPDRPPSEEAAGARSAIEDTRLS